MSINTLHKGDDDDDDDDNNNNNNNNNNNKTYFMGKITSCVAKIVNTEQLQHYTAYKHGLFQVYNCTYPVDR